MKTIFMVLAFFVLTKECNPNKNKDVSSSTEQVSNSNQQKSSLTITYEVQSRGIYEKLWVTQDSIKHSKDRALKLINSKKCPKQDWEQIAAILSNLDLHQLHEVDVPSKAFQYDGAPMATLKIMSDDVIYSSPIFDHENPPKAIEDVVNKLLELKEMIEKQ